MMFVKEKKKRKKAMKNCNHVSKKENGKTAWKSKASKRVRKRKENNEQLKCQQKKNSWSKTSLFSK